MKKMVCIPLLLMMVFVLVACGNSHNSYTTGVIAMPLRATSVENYTQVRDAVAEVMVPYAASFSSKALSSSNNKNYICSPLTAYFCLSLAAECTNGTSQSQILSALGIENVSQLREYADLFYNASTREKAYDRTVVTKEVVSNSLWLDPEFNYNQGAIDALSNSHHAFSIQASFRRENEKANKMLNDFIYDQSNGLLKTNFKLSDATIFALVSTLYVKDSWNYSQDLAYADRTYGFENYDRSHKDVRLLSSGYRCGQYLDADDYKAGYLTSVGNFKLYFVLPKGDADINDVMSEQNIVDVLSYNYPRHSDDGLKEYATRVFFPEFSVENTLSLVQIFNDMGILDAFNPNAADMSGLLSPNVASCFANALQANKLEVDKRGFEGASVTIIDNVATSGPPNEIEHIYYDLIVNRAYGFILTDTFNIPLFSGIIYNI